MIDDSRIRIQPNQLIYLNPYRLKGRHFRPLFGVTPSRRSAIMSPSRVSQDERHRLQKVGGDSGTENTEGGDNAASTGGGDGSG